MNRGTSKYGRAGGCWPSQSQALLLRAALLGKDAVHDAWSRWKQTASLEAIDPGSYRLLPLVYRNLTLVGVNDPLLARLKGVYRNTWYRNQIAMRDLAVSLRTLDAAGIRLLLLKGLALNHLYYRDLGLRPMADADVCVPLENATAAVAVLQRLGWRPDFPWSEKPWSEKRLDALHALGFHNAAGQAIDLHWHVLPESVGRHGDDAFWAAARPMSVADIRVYMLDPTDELFHTCAHGVRWNAVPPLRWVADAFTILRTTPDDIVWERVVATAQRHRLTLPIRRALRYLQTQFEVAVPPAVLEQLDRLPVSFGSWCEYRYRVSAGPHTVLGNLPQFWFHALRSRAHRSWVATFKCFLRCLEVVWDCEGLGQIGVQALARGIRRVRAR